MRDSDFWFGGEEVPQSAVDPPHTIFDNFDLVLRFGQPCGISNCLKSIPNPVIQFSNLAQFRLYAIASEPEGGDHKVRQHCHEQADTAGVQRKSPVFARVLRKPGIESCLEECGCSSKTGGKEDSSSSRLESPDQRFPKFVRHLPPGIRLTVKKNPKTFE